MSYNTLDPKKGHGYRDEMYGMNRWTDVTQSSCVSVKTMSQIKVKRVTRGFDCQHGVRETRSLNKHRKNIRTHEQRCGGLRSHDLDVSHSFEDFRL